MTTEQPTLTSLLKQVQAGSQEAAQTLYDLYASHVRQVIRLRLSDRLRRRFDSLDFCQDVWASIFTSPPEPDAFESPEKFVAFLTRMAQNKVTDATRQQLGTEKYDLGREEPFSRSNEGKVPVRLFAREDTPSVLAASKEAWDKLLVSLPPVHRRVLVLLHQGKTQEETAAKRRPACRPERTQACGGHPEDRRTDLCPCRAAAPFLKPVLPPH